MYYMFAEFSGFVCAAVDSVSPRLIEASNPNSLLSMKGYGLSVAHTSVRLLDVTGWSTCYDASDGLITTTSFAAANESAAVAVTDNYGLGLPIGTYLVCTSVFSGGGYTLQAQLLDAGT